MPLRSHWAPSSVCWDALRAQFTLGSSVCWVALRPQFTLGSSVCWDAQGPLSSQWHTVLIERLSFGTVVILGRSWAYHNTSTALFTSSGGLRPAVLLLDTLEDLGNFATFKDLHEPAGHELTWDEWMWHLTHSAMVIPPPDQLLCQLDKGTTGELSAMREFHRLHSSHCGDLWS